MSQKLSRFNYEKLASILHALGDADALRILDEAEKGFKSGKTTIKELNLTPRKYYRDIKKLNDTGVIASSGDEYKLTYLGELLYGMLLNDVSGFLLANQNLPEVMQKIGSRSTLTVIDDYKNLVSLLVTAIEKSKTEILLATKYLDFGVIQSLIFALERNVKLKTLTSEKIDFAAFIGLTGGVLRNIRPNIMKFSLGAGSNYRSGNVPLSFIIIDEEIAIFEIPNKQFKAAFFSTDKKTVKLLSGLFWELWNQSPKLHIPSF